MTDLASLLAHASAIVGKIGSGKTYVAKGVVETLLGLGRRVVIIDPTGVWWGLRSGAEGSENGGFPVMIFGGDHADVPITDQAGEAVALAIAEREVQCIIDLSDMTNAAKIRFMTPFLEHLYRRNRAALHLVVDEADEIAAQRLADGEQRMFGAFDKIVRRGRVKGFRPLMITQRPAVLHKNVISQISTLIALQLTSPQDRKAIDEWVKGNADTDQAKEVMSTLPTLSRGEGWVWAPADNVLERVEFPKIRTFDSSRTPENGETVVAPALTAVDVKELRDAMLISSTANEAAIIVSPDSKVIEAAEKRAYARGHSDGFLEGRNIGYRQASHTQMIRVVDALIGAAMLNGDSNSLETALGTMRAMDIGDDVALPPKAPESTKTKVDRKVATPTPAATKPENSADLSPSASKLVDAIVAAFPIGVSLQVAAKRAGISARSSAFRKYLKEAAASTRIRDRGDGRYVAVAAEEGITAPHGLSAFKDRLPPAYARMLEALEAASGAELDLDAISAASGVSRTSSGLTSGLRELVALDLIEKTAGGYRLSSDFL